MQRGPTSGNKSSNKSRQQIVNINLGDHVVRTVNTKTATTTKTTSKKRVSVPSQKKVSESTRPAKRRKAKTDDKPSISTKQKALADEMKSLSKQWHDAINAADPNFVTSEMSSIPNDLLSPDSISDMERLNDWLRQDIIKLNALPRKGAKSAAFNIPTNPAFDNQFGQQLSLGNIRAAEERADKLAKTQEEETTKVLNLRKDLEQKEKEIKNYAFYLRKRNERLIKAKEDLSQSKWSDMYGKLFKEDMSIQNRNDRIATVVKALQDAKKDVKQIGTNTETFEAVIQDQEEIVKSLKKEKDLLNKLLSSPKVPQDVNVGSIIESTNKAIRDIEQVNLFNTPEEASNRTTVEQASNVKKAAQTNAETYASLIESIQGIAASSQYQILKKPFDMLQGAIDQNILQLWGRNKVRSFVNIWEKIRNFKRKVRNILLDRETEPNEANFTNFIEEELDSKTDQLIEGNTPSTFFLNLYHFLTFQLPPTDSDQLVLIVTQKAGSTYDGQLAVVATKQDDAQNTIFNPFNLDTGEIDKTNKIKIRIAINAPTTPITNTVRSNFFTNNEFLSVLPTMSQLRQLTSRDDSAFDKQEPSPEEESNPPTGQPDFDQPYIDPNSVGEGSADLGPDLGQSNTGISVDPAVLQLNNQSIDAITTRYPPENTNDFMDKAVASLLTYLRANKTKKTIMNSIGVANIATAVAYFAAAQKYLYSDQDFTSVEKLNTLANTPGSVELVEVPGGGPYGKVYGLKVLGDFVMKRESLGGNNIAQRMLFTVDGIPYYMAPTNVGFGHASLTPVISP
jgi:hypothetical protein